MMSYGKSLIILIAVLLLFSAAACGDDDAPGKIYAAGYYGTWGSEVAAYWVDGERVLLESELRSAAYAITVCGEDVYAAGYIYEGGFQPCYWKNGVRHDLGAPNNTRAAAIAVDNGVPYIVANYYDDDYSYCWRESTLIVTKNMNSIWMNSIHVDNGDIYIAGRYQNDDDHHVVCYWMNDARVVLATHEGNSSANGLTVHNGKVYVSAAIALTANYWKDGQHIILDDNTGTTANDITVYNNAVYVSGKGRFEGTSVPCYWRNGKLHVFAGGMDVNPGRIFVAGAAVYMAAYNMTESRPAYYTEDGAVILESTNGAVFDIYVRE